MNPHPITKARAEDTQVEVVEPDVSWWRRKSRPRLWFLLLLLVGGISIALRLYRLDSSFDIFVDEITYLRLGQGLTESAFPPALYGRPFFLHPPLFFYLEAAWSLFFDAEGSLFDAVSAMRYLNVVLSGLTAATIFMIGKRMAGMWFGFAAALIFAVDPFTIRINSRVLLETAAVLFVALGFLVLISGVVRGQRIGLRKTIAAGFFFGVAILTKEVSVMVTIVPLIVMLVFGYALPRRRALTCVLTAVLVYLPYPLVAAAKGQWGIFLEDKSDGALRFMGAFQTTGFNRPGSTSFASRVLDLVESLGTTYVLLAVGLAAIVVLWWGGTEAERVLASWAASAYVYAGYSIVFGTLEEQAFYFVVVPAIVASVVMTSRVFGPLSPAWASLVMASRVLRPLSREGEGTAVNVSNLSPFSWTGVPRRIQGQRVAVIVGVLALTIASLVIWSGIHGEPDNAYARLVQYMDDNVPPGTAIAIGATSETAEFVLAESYVPVAATSIDVLRARDVQYVVVATKSIEDGTVFSGIADYDTFTEEREDLTILIEWLDQDGRIVFSADGRSTGTLLLYDVRIPLKNKP